MSEYINKVIDHMIEVETLDNDGFRKLKETLTRMGVPSTLDKILYQSCHVLHRQGKYYICHFKELFALDGKPTDITLSDISRRNVIAKLLQDWGLVKVKNEDDLMPMGKPSLVKIIKHGELDQWTLKPKYAIGNRSN
jgi:hypothetical protein